MGRGAGLEAGSVCKTAELSRSRLGGRDSRSGVIDSSPILLPWPGARGRGHLSLITQTLYGLAVVNSMGSTQRAIAGLPAVLQSVSALRTRAR